MYLRLFSSVALVALTMSVPAIAQDATSAETATSTDQVQQFTPADFEIYNPLTASDLVRLVPGFQVSASANLRGLGSNAGNVLINGEVPTSKADTLDNILARIPVSSIAKLELGTPQGATDSATRGRVLNIILKPSAGLTGTWRAGVLQTEHRPIAPYGSISGRTSLSQSTSIEFGMSALAGTSGYNGPELVSDVDPRNLAPGLIETRLYDQFGFQRQYSGNLALRTLIGGTSLAIRGKVIENHVRATRDADIFAANGQLIATGFVREQAPADSWRYEIGGDAERTLSSSLSGKLTLLFNREDRDSDALSQRTPLGGALQSRETYSSSRNDEALARLVFSRVAGQSVIQLGGEIARNSLEASFADASGPSPADDVDIAELRAEPFIALRTGLSSIVSGLSLDTAIVYEYSRITLDRPRSDERSYGYWKPRITLSYAASKQTNIDASFERQVSQLNFYDFATSSDLQNARINAGNPDLVPERAWVARASVRHDFGQGASVEFVAKNEQISDLIDRIPVVVTDSNGGLVQIFDAPGNIGQGRRARIEANLTLPLVRIASGLKGFELRYSGAYEYTRATDPVTNERRKITWTQPWANDVGLRYDARKFGIGGNVVFGNYSPVYYVDEFMRLDIGTTFNAWAELRGVGPFLLRLDVTNANGALVRRNRTLFNMTRAMDPRTNIDRFQHSDPTVKLTLSGRF